MDDAEFLEQFENCKLPYSQWTHRAHIRVAWLYLSKYSFEESLRRIRQGIQAYNRANQVLEGPLSGYNETTTHAFLMFVAATIEAYSQAIPTPNSNAFCDAHPQLMTQQLLRLFYSPAARTNPRAKTEFVEPDLAPLPKCRGNRG